MKRTLALVTSMAALLATVAACTPRDVGSYDCLGTDRPIYDIPDDHPTPWPPPSLLLENGTGIDARGQVFDNSVIDANGFSQGMKFHARTGSRDDLCLVGGRIRTGLDPENTSWDTWHRITGLHVEVDNLTIVGTSVSNEGDAFAVSAAKNWKIIGVRVDGGGTLAGGYIHDDCVENDGMNNGLVDDSKFDGCNIFMSSNSVNDGGTNTVEVRGTLVRLRPYKNNYKTEKYGENTHGGFFKWSNPANGTGIPPKLVVKDSVFRADQQGVFGGNSNGFLGLPPGTECDNVTLIGTAAWRTGDLASWQDQCTNLSYGTITDWNNLVAAWDADHPVL